MTTTPLSPVTLSPVTLGDIDLPHRLAMAPMTRSRALPDGTPSPLAADYYAQRASLGLLVTEGVQPSADGQGYLLTPGLHDDAHVEGWREIADRVHAAGGKLVVQLMHVGRVSHPDNTPHHRRPVAPSAVRAEGLMVTATGMQPFAEPRALSTDEIAATVADYRSAAAAAIAAGADGVEIHGANGYLVHQFLSSNANTRTDGYGGTVEGRIRFAVEVATAVAEEIGAGRTGIRVSPGNPYNDVREDDVEPLYTALLAALAPLGLAYLHVVHAGDEALLKHIRANWPTGLVVNRAGGEIAARLADVESGLADVTSFGVLALANPDLLARIEAGEFNEADRTTFYGGDARGYTDYPALNA
ncbi:alkene reductase [Actinosynnema mirum]|uniref:NADH:flavin oxidoreductase/NADH oxidase n=1 Tax=Actinosynnema mirum (strain ATCC 29888 / DSM 43827 / JCM 3225 / NBRC 14064 / NCIMB 13271 / NRRL B-12336 / IMRU 3971 / 101) TaxID=446462 RepID=C6WQN2_ACTMD|nr:alkene reductase [Actinosynnema mirum]ACU38722.1 NADH:flavin oxidoreductase/NADH oxidase [Actinosynnema mirum DSM 43827]AXX32319.1 Oxidoreductase, FMN-binding [Actinosynnema pretiosum subsp. pretiosum]